MAKTANSIPEMKIDDRLTAIAVPDLSTVPLRELTALYDAAELLDAAALGIINQPRVEDNSDILDRHICYAHMLQSAIYNEARKRTPANEDEAVARGKVLVERLLDWEKPWSAIAAVAAEVSAWQEPSTTEPAEEAAKTKDHKSVHDIVSDMEHPLGELEAQINVLEQLTEGYDKIGASDNQSAVAWTVMEIAHTRARVDAIWNELWEASKSYSQAVQS